MPPSHEKEQIALGIVNNGTKILVITKPIQYYQAESGPTRFPTNSSGTISQAVQHLFPGGKIQEGESPISAAMREVAEETGVRFRFNQIGFIYPVAHVKQHPHTGKEIFYYFWEITDPPPLQPSQRESIISANWVPISQLRLYMPTLNRDVWNYLKIFSIVQRNYNYNH